ncbi:MAG: acyl-CoA dehydrogenase family protein [Rhodospirillales bacterium]|nr:MAG: acyl-CoA dehydrogenase family protein [Rhodospirillales bacterium]
MTISASRGTGTPSTREALLDRARELLPALRERAAAAEEARLMPEETVRDFHESGLFRMLQPRRVGGSEMEIGFMVESSAVIARACASSAWSMVNLAIHHFMLGMWAPKAQDELWGEDADVLIASSLVFPAGKAKRVKGGFELSGRWPFSSGVGNSTWNMLAGMVADESGDAQPEARLFLVPDSDYEVIETWDAVGLCATGSHDVKAEGVFVPEHRTIRAADMTGGPTPGSEVNPGPLYRLPLYGIAPYVISGIPLGNALGAWELHTDHLRSRVSSYTGAKVSDFQAVQIKLADAKSRIDAAERLMLANCAEAMRIARNGKVPDIETKAKWRGDGAFSVKLCTEATDIVFGLAGGAGLYEKSPLQRMFRDAHAGNAHVLFHMDVVGTLYGRVSLGLPPESPLL